MSKDCEGVAWSRMPDSRDPMDKKEVQQMMEKAEEEAPRPGRDKALIAVLYLTGARISEVLELKREHVLLGGEKVRIKIRPGKRKNDTKVTFRHILPFSYDAPFMDEFLEHVKRKNEGEYLFSGYNEKLSRNRAWEIIKELNPDTTNHFFRHSRLTHLAEKGATGIQLRNFSGRKTIPKEYLGRSGEDLEELTEEMK